MARWRSYTSYSLFFNASDMTDHETEFLMAIADYQKLFNRRYPSWREVLTILHSLGYRKVAAPVPIHAPQPPESGRKLERKSAGETDTVDAAS